LFLHQVLGEIQSFSNIRLLDVDSINFYRLFVILAQFRRVNVLVDLILTSKELTKILVYHNRWIVQDVLGLLFWLRSLLLCQLPLRTFIRQVFSTPERVQ